MEDLLQCPICCVNYDSTNRAPRQLPCQHNLCSQCLPFMKKVNQNNPSNANAYIECPICREKFNRDLNDIPRSLVIVQLIDAATASDSQPSGTTSSNNSSSSSNQWNPPPPPQQQQPQQPPPPPAYNYYGAAEPVQAQQRQRPVQPPPQQQQLSSTNPFYTPPPAPPPPPQQQQQSNPYGNPYYTRPSPPPARPQMQPYHPTPPPSSQSLPPFYHTEPQPQQPRSSNQNSHYSNATPSRSSQQWNFRDYLRNIFNEIDLNRDGSITASELQRALRRCQSTEFDMKTIELLISKYDANGDREISFDEFYDLFNSMNQEYEAFLLTDADGSGFIDLDEFTEALKVKGYFFSRSFYEFIVNKICKRTRQSGIQFDIYIRVAARFDHLCQQYNQTLFQQKNSMENYLKENFFTDFW